MKKFLLIFVLSSQLLLSQNSINIFSDPVSVDEDFSIGIAFSNTDDISAFQFDLQFDNNVMQLRSGHSLTNRVGNHTISTNEIGDNIIRVVVISSTNETINSGTGTVVNLNFTSKNEPGSFDMNFSNVVFSDANGSEISISANNNPVTILGPKFKLVTTNLNFGRVSRLSNQSRTIEIYNEGNQTLEILSQNLTSPFSILETFPISIPAGSNFSISLTLDTTTSQVVSDQTLFETNDTDETRGLQELSVEADIYSVNEIYVGNNSGNLGSNILIPVSINNMDSFTSFQLDITIPSGVEYVQNSVALLGREEDHSISAAVINPNTLRVISYSPNNLNFNSTSGEVFSFSLLPVSNSGYHPLDISNSIISNLDLGDVMSDIYSGSITINAPFLNINPTLDFGRVPLSISTDKNISLANVGDSNLIINQIVYESSLLSGSLEAPLTLANGQDTEMVVTFTPESLGQFSSSILINHNSAENQNTIQVTADVFSPNYLFIEDKSVNRDNYYIINLGISNNDEIRAIQFDINIPDGFVFDYQNVQGLNSLNDFTISNSDLGNGNYRFVIYNLGSTIIPTGSNLLLDLPIYVNSSIPVGDYNFEISNITLSDASNSDVSSESVEVGVITVTDEVLDILTQQLNEINGYPNPFHSYYIINNPIPIEIEIYDVNGRVFINKYLEVGQNIINTSHLSSGFYLIKLTHNNRKKVDILIKK
ncbi:choice-of-anchor D domain-containing protein [Flavobacteriaceae bacterium]|nr:choice-of-anchor D domain-containing protein [Flavobacteriaceae bacterium]